jgi:tRNA(fMet)-specific endonuclease VapC
MNVWSGDKMVSKLYLLDTNIISAMLKPSPPIWKQIQNAIVTEAKIFISTISYYETKRGLLATQATTKLQRFDYIRQKYEMVGVDSEIVLDIASEIYVTLKSQGTLLPDADILIAAIAQGHGLTLVTNDSHFERIKGLAVENWVKMSSFS